LSHVTVYFVCDRYEQAYLAGVLGSRSGQYWIDVNDLAQPGTYQHTVGRHYLDFTNWAQNKPGQGVHELETSLHLLNQIKQDTLHF
jgi:hypothetical protein